MSDRFHKIHVIPAKAGMTIFSMRISRIFATLDGAE